MGLVRYRPLPLTPIKPLDFSTCFAALKQTAGPLGPSSTPLPAGSESHTQSASCCESPEPVLVWGDRHKDCLERSLSASNSEPQNRKKSNQSGSVRHFLCYRRPSTDTGSCCGHVDLQDTTEPHLNQRWLDPTGQQYAYFCILTSYDCLESSHSSSVHVGRTVSGPKFNLGQIILISRCRFSHVFKFIWFVVNVSCLWMCVNPTQNTKSHYQDLTLWEVWHISEAASCLFCRWFHIMSCATLKPSWKMHIWVTPLKKKKVNANIYIYI